MHAKGFRVVSFLLMLLMSGCLAVSNDDDIDPYDMENFDPSSNSMHGKVRNEPDQSTVDTKQNVEKKLPTMPVTEPQDEKENLTNKGDNPEVCRQNSSPCQSLFRQYIKSLLYHIKGKVYSGAEELNLRVKIAEAEVEYLEKFTASSESEKGVHHVHEILSSMIQLASEVQHGDPTVHRLWIESVFGMPLEKLLMFAAFVSIVGLIFTAANRFHFSWQKLAVKMVFFLFVISVFWQWYELYKKEEARQHATIMKDMPEGCRKREKEESFMKTMMVSFFSTFTFEQDECLKYYEHMLIDPFWKVTPTQALAKTVIRFFLSPAREIGEAIQELLTGMLKGLPAQLWPVALGFVGVFSFLLLFMYFGYRFSLPFGFIAIEPGQRADNSKMLEGMAEQKEQLLQLQESHRRELKEFLEVVRRDREEQLHQHQQILALPGVRDHLVKHLQVPGSQTGKGGGSLTGAAALPECLALQGSDAVFVPSQVSTAVGESLSLPGSDAVFVLSGESRSFPGSIVFGQSDVIPKVAMSSKSAQTIAREDVKISAQSVKSIGPEECAGGAVDCVDKLESQLDRVEPLASQVKKDLELTEEEKGLVFNTNLSGQSDSFEDISVSNIEGIGKRDN